VLEPRVPPTLTSPLINRVSCLALFSSTRVLTFLPQSSLAISSRFCPTPSSRFLLSSRSLPATVEEEEEDVVEDTVEEEEVRRSIFLVLLYADVCVPSHYRTRWRTRWRIRRRRIKVVSDVAESMLFPPAFVRDIGVPRIPPSPLVGAFPRAASRLYLSHILRLAHDLD
jgi:hypothetical protein